MNIALDGYTVFPVANALMQAGIPVVFATGRTPKMIPQRYRHIPRWHKPYCAADVVQAARHLVLISP